MMVQSFNKYLGTHFVCQFLLQAIENKSFHSYNDPCNLSKVQSSSCIWRRREGPSSLVRPFSSFHDVICQVVKLAMIHVSGSCACLPTPQKHTGRKHCGELQFLCWLSCTVYLGSDALQEWIHVTQFLHHPIEQLSSFLGISSLSRCRNFTGLHYIYLLKLFYISFIQFQAIKSVLDD